MDPIAEGLLEAIRPELGYRERAGQYTKFGEWYAENVKDPQYRNAPWCDMFIAWAAGKAGLQDYVGQFAWTPSHANWFKRQDAWSRTPEPGALVFFDWSGSRKTGKIDHVGVVERVDGGRIHTIEANVDGVWLKRKTRDEKKVVGYGLPRKVKENQVLRADPAGQKTIALRQADTDAEGFSFGFPLPVEGVLLLVVLVASVLMLTLANLRRHASALSGGRHRRRPRDDDSPPADLGGRPV
ncbi:CHAP domain-containing protein [Streptosporangium sp. KLBMP 9127]|nr:CHAP domain-containing protein [Streptosporangium sp. KLBMP 9127]